MRLQVSFARAKLSMRHFPVSTVNFELHFAACVMNATTSLFKV